MAIRRIPRNVFILGFVALASGFGQDLITPILPGFLALIGIGHAGVGLIDGLLQGTTSLFRFFSGLASDRFKNRKGLVFFGYALSSVARPLLALAGSLIPVAALRVTDGVGKGMKDAPRDALVADSAAQAERGRAFGFHRLVDTAGSVLGPLSAAGLLFLFTPSLQTYRWIFALAAIPGLIALALIMIGIREPERATVRPGIKPGKLPLTFWLFTGALGLAMLTKINDSLFLLRASDVGIGLNHIPLVFAGFTLIYALLSYPIGILTDRIGRLPVIAGGWLAMTIVELGFSRFGSIPAALMLLAIYGGFLALTEGPSRAVIADLVPAERRGLAYGIFNTIAGIALILGGYVLGRVWDGISAQTAFQFSAAGSLVSFVLLALLAVRLNKRRGLPAAA